MELISCPLVRLTKIGCPAKPQLPPGRWDTYEPGEINQDVSLPVDYVLVGYLLTPVLTGECVRVLRVERNGVSVLGAYQSTPVIALTPDGFATTNSTYRLEYLPPPL